ncbi:hypothetical protein ZIOFF_073553 [Zingiber officinale]|uniref:CRC domain-containing protein n=1 Tax=Zingiber officinale TaxID=94328 RepID=A0A8J5CT88_ZINOF|nr:hypothetical protein ZIOFF_073553 [Zingiber officinale]
MAIRWIIKLFLYPIAKLSHGPLLFIFACRWYCECFAAGVYCDGCNCTNCCNNVNNETVRHVAVEATLERNPNAFRPKIGSGTQTLRDSRDETGEPLFGRHNKGCHCKKSESSRNIVSAFKPIFSALKIANAWTLVVPILLQIYRSLLADTVRTEHVRDLCKLLVMVSGEVAQTVADRQIEESSVLEGHVECSPHSDYERDQSQKDLDMPRTSADECSSGIPLDKPDKEESRSECGERENGGKPMYPGTLVLMCNEKDMIFMASQAAAADPSSSNNRSASEAYVEQEKGVLTKFRDYLLKLVTCGQMKGKHVFPC